MENQNHSQQVDNKTIVLEDFIEMACGQKDNAPKSMLSLSTYTISEEDMEDVSKDLVAYNFMSSVLDLKLIYNRQMDHYYIKAEVNYKKNYNNEINLFWKIVREYIESDNENKALSLLILPISELESSSPIMMELIDPVYAFIESETPGTIASTVSVIFNIDSTIIHEQINELINIKQLNDEVEFEVEQAYQKELDQLEETEREQEYQQKMFEMQKQNFEENTITRVGRNENKDI